MSSLERPRWRWRWRSLPLGGSLALGITPLMLATAYCQVIVRDVY